MKIPVPRAGLTTEDVFETLQAGGQPLQEWGRAADGAPLLAARTGGSKRPAIFITAGSHAPETAGVHAALNLLAGLETEHEVHVLPLRDPLGFAGANHCLSVAAGRPVRVAGHQAALDYLVDQGQIVWQDGVTTLFKLGDMGFMWIAPMPGYDSFHAMHTRMLRLTREDPGAVRPLWGCRVMLLCAMIGVEGCDELQRCWHGLLTPDGQWMHLNRLFGREDAPAEVAGVDRLMRAVRPGLTCDLHEGRTGGFWMPKARPKENPERIFDMTKAYLDEIAARGYPITTWDEWIADERRLGRGYDQNWIAPEPRLPGLFWTQGLLRGEGYNLGDYAGLFGLGFGTEAPLSRPLAMRVDGITNGMLAAIRVWEQGF